VVGLVAHLGRDHKFKELVLNVCKTSDPLPGMELLVMGQRSAGLPLPFSAGLSLVSSAVWQLQRPCASFCSAAQGPACSPALLCACGPPLAKPSMGCLRCCGCVGGHVFSIYRSLTDQAFFHPGRTMKKQNLRSMKFTLLMFSSAVERER